MSEDNPLATLQTMNVAPGAKATNVLMQNQQAVMIEYYSEAYIPEEIQEIRPIESMMIQKRAIGNETEWDNAILDLHYNLVSLVREIAGEEVALDLAMDYINYKEGLRARGMAERTAQVTQRTLTLEELKTISASNKIGVWDRFKGFARGEKKQPINPFQNR